MAPSAGACTTSMGPTVAVVTFHPSLAITRNSTFLPPAIRALSKVKVGCLKSTAIGIQVAPSSGE